MSITVGIKNFSVLPYIVYIAINTNVTTNMHRIEKFIELKHQLKADVLESLA